MSQYPIVIPELVLNAKTLAERLGFDLRPEGNAPESGHTTASCCLDEVGSLLQTLCASVSKGKVGEIGTGVGVGTAWLASGLQAGVELISVEMDSDYATEAATLFAELPAVKIINEDWHHSFAERGPYQLLFADGGGVGMAGEDQWQGIADLVNPGGMMVMDDLTPEEFWPESWHGTKDPKREFAFNSGFFHATEIRSRLNISTLLMTRK